MTLDSLPNSVIPDRLPSGQQSPNCASQLPSTHMHTHTCTHYIRFSTWSRLTLSGLTHTHTQNHSQVAQARPLRGPP